MLGKTILTIFLILATTICNWAREPSNTEGMFVQGKAMLQEAINTWNLQQMMAARNLFERLLADSSHCNLAHYYVALCDLRIFHQSLQKEDKDQAKRYIENGIEHMETAVENDPVFAEGLALLSTLYGNKIGLNPFSGMTLGPKSGKAIEKAFELAPENPRVSFIAGQSAFYTPKMFGGGKDKARKHLLKAVECFQTFQPEQAIDPDWGEEEAYTFLGLVANDEDSYGEAKQYFEKALEINPNWSWVKDVLLPELDKKMVLSETE